MKTQLIIVNIAALILQIVVADELPENKGFNWGFGDVDNSSTTLPAFNDEDCYARSLGLPCCNENEIIETNEYGNWGKIEGTDFYCGIGYPEKKEEEEEKMFGNYPYCDGCETNYTDKDGGWYYTNKTWCKVNEKKCFNICEPVKGYQCCKDSSTKVISEDNDGTWGIENKKWCLIQTIPEFNDFEITADSVYDGMPGQLKEKRFRCIFKYPLDNFKENYEIVSVIFNGNPINPNNIVYYNKEFRFYPIDYLENNEIKMILRNKETNQKYFKIFNTKLIKLF